MEEQENQSVEAPSSGLLIDEAMLPFSDFVARGAAIEGQMEDAGSFSMEIDKVELGMPIQLDIQVDEEGHVVLGGSPPLYYVETTFMPVFHQLEMKLESFAPATEEVEMEEGRQESQ